jgi:CheY-like chemotaxis protein
LARAGYEVEIAGDGWAACERLLKGPSPPPELLVVDLQMPRMDGFEMIAYLREHNCSVPAIAISADSEAFRRCWISAETSEKLRQATACS